MLKFYATLYGMLKADEAYQDELSRLGIKDDRVRRPITRGRALYRISIRLVMLGILALISIPGFILWTPVLLITFYAVHNFKKTGPVWDTFDEIAQYKLIYGLFGGVGVWLFSTIVTFPLSGITFFVVPALMWMTLRWVEDAVSTARALFALARLVRVEPQKLETLREQRKALHARVLRLGIETLGLPSDAEVHFLVKGEGSREKGRVRSRWESGSQYFSVRRRRKRGQN